MALKNMIDWLVTPPNGASAGGQSAASNQHAPAGSLEKPAVRVLVCDFDGTDGRESAVRLVNDLGSQPGILVQHLTKKLKISGKETLVERMVAAAETGRKWLLGSSADVLVWGEITPEDLGIKIRILCAVADADTQPGSVGLADVLDLPIDYDDDMAAVIHAAVLAAVGPRKPSPQREEIELLLNDTINRLNAYIDAPPSNLEPIRFASVMSGIGNILASLWRLNQDPSRLDRSIQAYQVALDKSYDSEGPLVWALTQNHLASALRAKSSRDNDPAPLRAAAEAYSAAAAALGEKLYVNDWALAYSHLGDVRVKLSKFDDPLENLKQASAAYQQALKVFTRQTMPGPWAELMNQLGVALMKMGDRVEGDRILEQSAACFRQSLEVRRRDITPLLWAQSANNLGAVTFSLFKRNGDTAILGEGATCFKGASEIFSEFGQTEKSTVAHRNFARLEEIQKSGSL